MPCKGRSSSSSSKECCKTSMNLEAYVLGPYAIVFIIFTIIIIIIIINIIIIVCNHLGSSPFDRCGTRRGSSVCLTALTCETWRPRLLTRRLRGHASRHCCTSSSKQRCTACTAPAATTSQAFVHRRVVRALQMVRDGDPPRSSERGGGLRHAGWMATVDAPVAPKPLASQLVVPQMRRRVLE